MVKSMLHERTEAWSHKYFFYFLNDSCLISDCREHKQNMDHLRKKKKNLSNQLCLTRVYDKIKTPLIQIDGMSLGSYTDFKYNNNNNNNTNRPKSRTEHKTVTLM